MSSTKRGLRLIGIFTLAFVVCGVLHIALYGVDYANSAVQLYVAVLVLLWGYSLRERIINKAVLLYLYAIVFCMEVLLIAQAARYALFSYVANLERYAWYAFYIPFILIPVFFNQVAFRLNMQKNDKIKQWWKLLDIPAICLLFLVVTNDFHEIVFRFPEGLENGVRVYTYGAPFYAIWVLIIAQNILSLLIIYRQCAVNASRKMLWLPVFFEIVAVAGQLMYFTDSFVRIDGVLVWNQGEFYIFAGIGLVESCVEMGLIPANMNYKKLFYLVNDMAVIYDKDGNAVYTSEAAETFFDQRDVLVNSVKLKNGTVKFGIDMGPVYRLNKSLEEENARILARNKLLKSQNELESEQSRLNVQNALYDRVSLAVKPKLSKIRKLLDDSCTENFNHNLAMIAVINAYIKRRSNLELLDDKETEIDVRELTLALHESYDYIKLLEADVLLSANATGKIPRKMAVLFYDFFETVVEDRLETLKSLMITFSQKGESYKLSMQVNATDAFRSTEFETYDFKEYGGKLELSHDDGDESVSLTMTAGGDI